MILVMKKEITGFQWDRGNSEKCQKHGVSLAEIEALFLSGSLTVFHDPSPIEPRLRAIGKTESGRYVFMVYALRECGQELYIRPISARYMHQKEVDYYEKEISSSL
jgi:uncharacterized protein